MGSHMATARSSSYFSTNHNLMYVSEDKRTTFEEIYPPGLATFSTTSGADEILAAAKTGLESDITVNVTGHDPLEEASSKGGGGNGSVVAVSSACAPVNKIPPHPSVTFSTLPKE